TELAAARINLLSPQAILSRLAAATPGSALRLLTGGARDLPSRHQTLRATIAWSYDLLAPEEQQLFRRLAVFVGGGTFEPIEAVVDAGGDLGLDLLDGLSSLVNKSLLRQDEQPDGEPRLLMLDTVREFALEQLGSSGEEGALRQRHTNYYTSLAEEAEPKLR